MLLGLQKLALVYAKTAKLFPEAKQTLERGVNILSNRVRSNDPRMIRIEITRARIATEIGDWTQAHEIFTQCSANLKTASSTADANEAREL